MKVSIHGLKLLEVREGIRLKAYKDSRGLPTIGVGHLIVPADHLKVGDTITQAQCDAFLAQDIKQCEDAVNAVGVPLTQWQFDALCSFCFNVGVGQKGFKGSTVRKRLVARDYNGVAQAMMLYKKPPEIIGRRQTEVNQFLHPDHWYSAASTGNSADAISQPATTPAGDPSAPPK